MRNTFPCAIVNQFRLPVSIFHDHILVWGNEPKVIKPNQKIEKVESLSVFDREGNILSQYTQTQEDEDYEIRRRFRR